MQIILASSSPRRSRLLTQIRIPHKIIPSSIKEKVDERLYPHEIVKNIASNKARVVAKNNQGIIIGADTIVYLNKILGKPNNKKHAIEMLRELSGKTHEVYTGLAIINNRNGYREVSGFEKTLIKMRKISDYEIKQYLKVSDPYDAAGSYKIQGIASLFIEKIEGCYFNVMGFPIFILYQLLNELEINIWDIIKK
ncbi:MAG: septum formation protein Maf [Candidatus Lokiarchaeota archaeon]|nr:septum formation protein Maf [Candidatus Lokiarchaeota archaeon]